ncbi:MAG TPA: aminotransferase [Eubacterium sp.]|nr:aminotransferase [Eubacterium sp.]
MKNYLEMTREELESERSSVSAEYEKLKGLGLKLDMSRGKPSKDQLDLSMDMLDVLKSDSSLIDETGLDCRNYGGLDGIREAKELMAGIMNVSADNVIVCGNASLNIMYDTISRSMTHGVCGSTPWCKLDKVKFLCPVPGYDRHFAITQNFGIEMINIPMTEAGPDMDMVEKLVSEDSSVKGIWCVPKFSNPQGYVYSDETVKRLAALKPAASDFRIYWDNAYAVHELYDEVKLLDIFAECEKNGNSDMVFEFASTSKISFAGGGISAVASSKNNLDFIKKTMTVQTIGYDKVNELRHVRYFKNIDGIKSKMKEHAKLLAPKFEAVLKVFDEELKPLGIAEYTRPLGGYFISFETMEGCAKDVVAKCKDAGVVLTKAGAPFPYGIDPKDTNIRIAPSFPSPAEMEQAAKVFVVAVKLSSLEKLLSR